MYSMAASGMAGKSAIRLGCVIEEVSSEPPGEIEFGLVAEETLEIVVAKELALGLRELAEVFLAEGAVAHGEALSFEEGAGDARAVGGGDADAGPVAGGAGPGLLEETALAVRGAHEPQGAVADGEHRGDRVEQVVGDAGRFVDEEEARAEKPRMLSSLPGRPTMREPLGRSSEMSLIAVAC